MLRVDPGSTLTGRALIELLIAEPTSSLVAIEGMMVIHVPSIADISITICRL